MAKSDDVGFHSLVLVLGCWLVVIIDVRVSLLHTPRRPHACLLQSTFGAGLTVGSAASFGIGNAAQERADMQATATSGGRHFAQEHSTLCIERSSEVRRLPRFLKAIDRTERTTSAYDWIRRPAR